MKLVVIIPALNEEMTIGKVIKSVPRNIEGIDKVDVLVVNDGSIDKTVEVSSNSGAYVVSHPINKGVGAAFQTGIERALEFGADIIVNIDADGQFNPSDIPKVINPILKGKADMVTASRFKDKTLIPIMPWHKKLGNKFFSWLTSSLIGQKFYDTQCGFRAYSRKAAMHLNLFGNFTYTQEAFLDLASKGMRIVEVPLKIRGVRQFGNSRVAHNVIKYGFNALNIIIKTVRDYKPLMFFGVPGFIIFLIGLLSGLFMVVRYIFTHTTTPFQSLIIFSAVMLILGFLMIVLALIADMLDRLRKNQERILFELKRNGK